MLGAEVLNSPEASGTADEGGAMDDRAFILFSVGPVQPFIAAARSLRDLWTGSFLLAWLTRQAMTPILEMYGPAAFVEPDMTNDPMGSDALRKKLRSPCLPNRFLAEVPRENAEQLAQACENAFREAWREVADRVRDELQQKLGNVGLGEQWREPAERLWDKQIDSFFDVRWVVLPWEQATEQVTNDLLGPAANQGASSNDWLWTRRAHLAAKLLAARRAIRKITPYKPDPDEAGMYPGKCSLMGTYEQIGPAKLADAANFWQMFAQRVSLAGVRIRANERLCAISLVKRFAWPAYFSEIFGSDPRALRFEDIPTIAAAKWLMEEPALDPEEVRRSDEFWSGQWLHWTRPDQDEDEKRCPEEVWQRIEIKRKKQGGAPTYYAILVMDGDRMGQHLRAQPGPNHPCTISRALTKFAVAEAEGIVEAHSGTLIYCGGDDILALFPTHQVLACAQRLNEKFREIWAQEMETVRYSSPATLSAGIAVVHIKEDLRFALQMARDAEKRAKNAGRNILGIMACRRSGEHTFALCPWPFLETVKGWVEAFSPRNGQKTGASDRWARHLYQELPVLQGLQEAAIKAEVRRQVNRAEEETRRLLCPEDPKKAGEKFLEKFDDFCRKIRDGGRFSDDLGSPGELLKNFLELCQTASFLARRRDE